MGIRDIDLSPVVPIDESHDGATFDCGVSSLNRWLATRAWRNEVNSASRTYVVASDRRVIGYYAISTTEVDHDEVSGSVRRNMPEPIPGILLGRLAVDRSAHGLGVGAGLLQDAIGRAAAIATTVGARVLVVDALSDDAARFYRRFGFRETRTDPMTLYLDIRAVAALTG